MVPFFLSLVTFFTTNLDLVKICIVSHTSSKWPNFATMFLIFTALVVIYILYGMIIFKYWRLKRQMSVRRKKNYGDDQEKKGSVIAKKAQKIFKFLSNSKYVIVVISVFTLCWTPWILLVFYDITFHQLGSFEKTKEMRCGQSLSRNLTVQEEFLGQACIYGLLSGDVKQCEVPGDEEHMCEAVHEHLHDFLIVCISCVCVCFSVIGSLINPLIHGIWCPGFRQAVEYLRRR